jgi:hypothetical protein
MTPDHTRWFQRELAKIDRHILKETNTEEQKRELRRRRARLFDEGGKMYEAYLREQPADCFAC